MTSALIYCPYTDSDLPINECSPEHIIPLALGGTNGFEVPVSAPFNSKVGSEIDGAMAKDFLVIGKRNKHDIRGHSGKRPLHIVRNAHDADTLTPLQIHLDQREGLKVWNPIGKKFITENRPQKLSIGFKIDLDLHFRFVAKVALSAGYFVYGNLFRTAVKHSDFRAIMNHPSGAPADNLSEIEALADSMFYQTDDQKIEAIRMLCKASSPYSIVGLVPSHNHLAVFVGILGDYIGMLTVPADTSAFPNEGAFHWGHVIQLHPKSGLIRTSLMDAIAPPIIQATHEHAKNITPTTD